MTSSNVEPTGLILPPTVVTKVDVSRLVTEVEAVDNALTTADVRSKTTGQNAVMPTISQQLNDFIALNKLSLVDSKVRSELVKQMRALKDKAPVMHMTFAVEADRESLSLLVKWLRESIHPQAVLSVGLQPGLVAGVFVRTPNHVHDFSLRGKLDGSHDILVKELESLHAGR